VNLTLIIPTYNRQNYALRSLKFWSDKNVVVHVLDGSKIKIADNQLNGLGSNVNYHHLPVSISKRLCYATSLITTDFTALLGDDEFFLLNGLNACVNELNIDKGLVACLGSCIAFKPINNDIIACPAYTSHINHQIDQNDPIDRMIYHLSHYNCTTIYSVVRSEIWKKAVNTLIDFNFSIWAIEELLFEMIVSFSGKSKVINTIMWLRSAENSESYRPFKNNFTKWWGESENNDEKTILIEHIVKNLSNGSKLNTNTLRTGVIQALNCYYNLSERSFLESTYLYFLMNRFIFLVRRIFFSKIPIKVKKSFRKFLFNCFFIKNEIAYFTLIEISEKYKNDGVPIEIEEIIDINNFILDL